MDKEYFDRENGAVIEENAQYLKAQQLQAERFREEIN